MSPDHVGGIAGQARPVSRARRPVGVAREREGKGRLVSSANILAKPHSRTHVMQQWACLNPFSDWNSCEAPGVEKFATSYQLG